ncbi:hypothetical protein [Telluribacter sp. SYSU D00476]|uniref:hypothetical protein n=1 Tax=Telluribacter sp. SYSU D00476 TaxID=2811430 RepID=UPI001FF29470|nr:hypothetical protein [Telluribacter sp. SYSU D00476]
MQNKTEAPVQRPIFLTVLCVLTFISAVAGLFTQSERLWTPGVVADQMLQMFEQFRDNMEARGQDANADMVNSLFDSVLTRLDAETIRTSAIILLIYESLTLYGAYLMWGLQKRGYHFYIGGVAVALVAPMLLIGGWLGVIVTLGEVFFSIIFSGLYALNLKYMH